jgi:RimJ/RimL family protein N-acetyltransferase
MMVAEEFSERIDKLGNRFLVSEVKDESCASLKEMYDGFSRTDLNQGLPPPDEKIRDQWIQTLLKSANNFLAWNHGKVIGHSSLMAEMQKRDAEFIIFVSGPYRSRGVGTELTLLAVDKAKELGLNKIWLTVESFNFRAIGLYQKVGFRLSGAAERERVMVLNL